PTETGAPDWRSESSACICVYPAFIAHSHVYLCAFAADRVCRSAAFQSWLGLFTPVGAKSVLCFSEYYSGRKIPQNARDFSGGDWRYYSGFNGDGLWFRIQIYLAHWSGPVLYCL